MPVRPGKYNKKKRKVRNVRQKKASKLKFHDRMYFDTFMLVREGHNLKKVAEVLGVDYGCIQRWRRWDELYDLAITYGKQNQKDRNGDPRSVRRYEEFVFGRLPRHLQRLWNKLATLNKKKATPEQLQRLLDGEGKLARQCLLAHAVLHCHFNTSKALRKVGISRATYDKWVNEDEDFQLFLQHVMEAKKDFFEGGLIDLVAERNPSATIFVNRTMNQDRGYVDTKRIEVDQKVEHSGNIDHNHIDVTKLDLPVETLKLILEKHREYLKSQGIDPLGKIEYKESDIEPQMREPEIPEVIEAEFERIEDD